MLCKSKMCAYFFYNLRIFYSNSNEFYQCNLYGKWLLAEPSRESEAPACNEVKLQWKIFTLSLSLSLTMIHKKRWRIRKASDWLDVEWPFGEFLLLSHCPILHFYYLYFLDDSGNYQSGAGPGPPLCELIYFWKNIFKFLYFHFF